MTDFVCPLTRQPLARLRDRMERADGAYYPITDGIPILLGPEIQGAVAPARTGHYAEAYAERGFYDLEADALRSKIATGGLENVQSDGIRVIRQIRALQAPFPSDPWLSADIDAPVEMDCWNHLAPIKGQRVLQLGGTGMTAVAFLLGGAASAVLVTPMLCEARLARAIAEVCNVELECVVGIGEEIPLWERSVDVMYSGGCVHHMTTALAFPEIKRVLAPNGRFAAAEPWRAPFYALGTKVFGKREPNAFCRPLTPERVAPIYAAFPGAKCVQHGALSRYPLLAAGKVGLRFPMVTARTITRCDDAICDILHLRRFGSGVALLATRGG